VNRQVRHLCDVIVWAGDPDARRALDNMPGCRTAAVLAPACVRRVEFPGSRLRGRGPATRIAKSGAAFLSTGGVATTLFCTVARLTHRQLCGLVQRPSETGPAVAPHRALEWDKANPGTV